MENEKTYVEKVNDWLNADPATRTIEVGARLMLQGNRNRILHENVLRKSNFDKVIYELTKMIGNERAITIAIPENIEEIKEKVATIELKPEITGKRADHDSLPEEIKLILENNVEIYHTMRSLFERLKVLSEDGHTEAERFPFLSELLELDATLTANWETYDTFDVNAPVYEKIKTGVVPGVSIDAKRVSANRKYLSDNKAKYTLLVADNKTDKAAELLARMQIRFDELILNGETFAPDQMTELQSLGLIVAVTEEMEKEPVAGTQVVTEGEEVLAPAGEKDEETHEENVISQIKTLLNNSIPKDVILSTISSLGKFGELVLTPEVVEDLYNKAVEQEMNAVE